MPVQCAEPRLLLITGAPASGKTRLARDLGRRDRRIEATAGNDATFPDPPRARLRFNSEAQWQAAFAVLCDELDRWSSAAQV
jgi:uridine kinase